MRLQEQHYFVTGAGTGIGRAIAIRLANDGAILSILGRRESPLQEVVKKIEGQGGKAQYFCCDIRNKSHLYDVFASAKKKFGPLRGLIANSGIGGANEHGENDRFYELVQTNLIGTYDSLRAGQVNLIQDNNIKNFVLISSCLARFGVPGYSGYCASKSALLGLTRALSLELASQRIQVNAICPGWVNTQMARDGIQGMADAMGISYEEAYAEAMRVVPLGRMSQPEEIAGMVSWLVSADGVGVTGQGLDINGGSWMG
jgi:NAD(P)-dependent dehydrogenase (short-subunit alcohol dehydrogenase family)